MKFLPVLKKILVFIILFSFFSLTISFNRTYALEEDMPLYVDFKHQMFQTSITTGYFQNANSIYIDLPSSDWNIKDVEINFTNIRFDTETIVIEDNIIQNKYSLISKANYGYGVQIKIEDSTILYGVQIYGNNISTQSALVYVQINGYNNQTNAPNNDIYGSPILLNMSYSVTAAWHTQTFSSPINLEPGNYYLTLNGTDIGLRPQPKYNWYYNDINSTYPELYWSSYKSSSWSDGTQGAPFLYKLIQKLNTPVYPENINMTANINGNTLNVSNGKSQNTGYFSKIDLNYKPNKDNLNIKISNNKTSVLIFNGTYNFKINNIFKVPSQLTLKINQTNKWTLNPEITRFSNNDTIRIEYPNSWYNLIISRNLGSIWENINSEVIIDSINKFILIPNITIQDDILWKIEANSPNIEFELDYVPNPLKVGQKLLFSVKSPLLIGNYTFTLFDAQEQVYTITKELPLQENIFDYNITQEPVGGNYYAYVIWNNKTDAGVQMAKFEINNQPIPPDPPINTWILIIIIGSVSIGGLVIVGSSYKLIKRLESKKRENIKLILEKCTEIMSLKYIIVLHNKSGIDIYSQSFEDEEIDPTLISGFLQAIHNFGTEVLEKSKDTKTVKVEYKKSFILMTEFVNLRLIIIMGQNPSKNFLFSVESLAYYIYRYYGNLIDNFNGGLKKFQGISKLVEKILNVSFIAPLEITVNKNVKLNQDEKLMVNKASKFMQENNFEYFYSLYLLPDNTCSPKDYEIILKLIEKGIFHPVEKNNS
ncbi:MAG: hypothetical protein ACFFCY_05605 [Promethearchaeota archaeon]